MTSRVKPMISKRVKLSLSSPDSSCEMASRSSTMAIILLMLFSARNRYSLLIEGSSRPPSSRVSTYPWILKIGVFSSCETLPIKSLRYLALFWSSSISLVFDSPHSNTCLFTISNVSPEITSLFLSSSFDLFRLCIVL